MNENEYMRIDFEFAPVIDPDTGEEAIMMMPDRRRYKYIEAKDSKEAGWLDEVDRVFFPVSVVDKMVEDLPKIPQYDQHHRLEDLPSYVNSRRDALKSFLEGDETTRQHTSPEPTAHQVDLVDVEQETVLTAVLYADLVGSTELSRTLPSRTYARVISIFREEMLATLPTFHGLPLKTVGDAVVAYFAAPSMNNKADLSIDCALLMRLVVDYVINPTFEEFDLPRLQVAIALDAGKAQLIPDVVGLDLAGHVLNRLKRIQELAEPGRVLLGDYLFRILHQSWRERCEEIDLPENWPEQTDHGQPYKIFEVVQ